MTAESNTYLLVLGEQEGLIWVLTSSRMAFTASRAPLASRLQPGDQLLLYLSRGALHNPTRDRGRIIGRALVDGPVMPLRDSLWLGGREFVVGCARSIQGLAPFQRGVELAPLVRRLRTFPNKRAWSARMRQPLVRVADEDIPVLASALRAVEADPGPTTDSYLGGREGSRRDADHPTSAHKRAVVRGH